MTLDPLHQMWHGDMLMIFVVSNDPDTWLGLMSVESAQNVLVAAVGDSAPCMWLQFREGLCQVDRPVSLQ